MLQEVVSSCKMYMDHQAPIMLQLWIILQFFYYNTGDYKLAEKFFVEAVGIYKKSPEAGSIQTGICINNLGAL